MLKTKEEKVLEAWKEVGIDVKEIFLPQIGDNDVYNFIIETGRIDIYDFKMYYKDTFIETLYKDDRVHYNSINEDFIPKSLEGLWNNNGWNNIDEHTMDDADINEEYWLYDVDGNIIELSNYDGKWMNINDSFTHYKIKEKPKKPLFTS